MSKKSRVRIIYKSGAEVIVECDNFIARWSSTGGLVEIKWESAVPKPLYAGVDEIAAIWEIA